MTPDEAKQWGDRLYEERMLVLMERDGKFQQVLLTQDQYKALGELVSKPCEEGHNVDLRPPYECRHMDINEDWQIDADLFLGLESYEE